MKEENERLKTAALRAFLLLQAFRELKLDFLAATLHVDGERFAKALRETGIFKIKRRKGEVIVSLGDTGFHHQLAVVLSLKSPETVEGGNEVFRKLLSVDDERKVAIFIHQLPDGKILAFEGRKLKDKPRLHAFLPLRGEQIKLTEDRKEGLMISADISGPQAARDFKLLGELLDVEGEWEFLGIYTFSLSNNLIRKALDQGGLVIEEITEEA